MAARAAPLRLRDRRQGGRGGAARLGLGKKAEGEKFKVLDVTDAAKWPT
jgi:hypothetical protein